MTDSDLDDIIIDFYRASSDQVPWGVGLEKVRQLLSAQVVNLYGAIKSNGAMAFSFEVGEANPEAALDFIRKYHQIDPRAALVMSSPVGQVLSCHRHFDEAFVAQSPFYQEFLIPYGGRYSSGMKVYEDNEQAAIWGVHRPNGAMPVNEYEEDLIRRLGMHLHNAVTIFMRRREAMQPAALGLELLQRMPQPMLLLDETRRIVFCNPSARDLLNREQVLFDKGGLLSGSLLSDDAQLLIALRSLGLSSRSYLGGEASEKVFLRMMGATGGCWGVYLYAMRPDTSLGAFGSKGLALVLLHDQLHHDKLDPFVVAATYDLSPAEARVAIALKEGLSAEAIASKHGVSLNTIRTQIRAAMEKMGVSRQAQLVRQLASMPPSLI
ncbi:LuxR C-terminal-related transcriptional regulator [Aquabacterium sp.]|uniref:LuxR C-terminal-related transcriptional regulator n=1 Tax=Aquabacterium sp. TaxID=1872578 RepID=UPI002E344FF0|nr:LuxR C-terminal-related transcriptional regulator [Aquabacterium sp.]HEX5310552.1 LuxR C-terminal-related transcriptional regulator [Aquabacterium sp.]